MFHYRNNLPLEFLEKIITSLKLIDSFQAGVNYLSFNGGKDCLVVFLLFKLLSLVKETGNLEVLTAENLITLLPKGKNYKIKKNSIRFIYFANSQYFSEEEEYVFSIVNTEQIQTVFLYSDYVNGLNFLKSKFPDLSNIYMGIRQSDLPKAKHINQNYFEKSTSPYPSFNRIYPILNWLYEDVWRLIIIVDYPYLSLYNKGYTSIGKIKDTTTNKTLHLSENQYLPAYCLTSTETERQFRNK